MFLGEWFADNAIMYSILEELPFYSGTERQKMLYTKAGEGGSMLYGTTWKSHLTYKDGKQIFREYDDETGRYKTKIYSEYPALKEIFKEFADYHFPDFEYKQLQMNKNFPCPPHYDSKNVGESVLCVFGDFKDGQTCLFNADTKKIDQYDARLSPLKFDGSKILHWVRPIRSTGTRYSLVFFNNKVENK
tara:strand:+ start:30 stop:596 length:567 start_codon:yes stop_codon:yes gene_type:complete